MNHLFLRLGRVPVCFMSLCAKQQEGCHGVCGGPVISVLSWLLTYAGQSSELPNWGVAGQAMRRITYMLPRS